MVTVKLILILIGLLACQVRATNWYVGTGGSDANGGHAANDAKQTINEGFLDSLSGGDTVVICTNLDESVPGFGTEGSINGTLMADMSGSYGSHIVFISHPDSTFTGNPNTDRAIVFGEEDVADETGIQISGSYLTFKNIDVRYSSRGFYMQGAIDSVEFINCSSKKALVQSDNNGGWCSNVEPDTGPIKYVTWKNCEVDSIYRNTVSGVWDGDNFVDQNNSGWHLYKSFYCIWDSCTVPEGAMLAQGIFFKVNGYRNEIRYCFLGDPGASVQWTNRWGDQSNESSGYVTEAQDSCGNNRIHHNIFSGPADIHVVFLMDELSYSRATDTNYFYNNGFYNAGRGVMYTSGEPYTVDAEPFWQLHKWWNNAFVDMGGSSSMGAFNIREADYFDLAGGDACYVDYNGYYHSGGSSLVGSWDNGSPLDLSGWQSASGLDANSSSANPNFADVPNGDWSHTGSTPAFYTGGGTQVEGSGFYSGQFFGSDYVGPFDSCDVQGGDGSSCLDATRTRVKGVRQ